MRNSPGRLWFVLVPLLGVAIFIPFRYVESAHSPYQSAAQTPEQVFTQTVQPFFAHNCYSCHNGELETAQLDLESYQTAAAVTGERKTMEHILQKLNSGAMPPKQMPRPKPDELKAVTEWLSQQLGLPTEANTKPQEATARTGPAPLNPGRVTARRLNRTEYNNTVRDLLGVDSHPADDFPQDDSGYGFDNIGDVLSLSPVLMEKYMASAEKIARTAVFGHEPLKPTLVRLRSPERNLVPRDTPLTDYDVTGLSLPNAMHNSYRFPVAGEYVIRARLGGQRPPGSEPLETDLWIDGQLVKALRVDPATVATFAEEGDRQELGSIEQEFRVKLSAGEHWLAVAITRLYEGLPVSYKGPNPAHRPVPPMREFKPSPDLTPKQIEEIRKKIAERKAEKIPANSARVGSLEIGGPYAAATGPSAESLKKIYACGHLNGHHTRGCARIIVEHLAHRAYRRPLEAREVNQLTSLVSAVQNDSGSLEEGIATAIQAMLLSPHFLFRIERNQVIAAKKAAAGGAAQPISQHELAARLSYFLWSSMPDDALLAAADRGQLAKPAVLEAQVRRMLLDPKSRTLAENFAGQWLETRKLESVKPDRKRFPEFDEYLRRSMRQETELFFDSIVREDRSILDFIDAKYTFMNERLAQFYDVKGVQGPEFRKVTLAADSHRGGIVTQASVLTVSSYATRTSPVLRGKWILGNLLDAAPPPPPPDVPNLDDAKIGTTSSLREQLEQHRKNATCASCHVRMDPLGFGLENFNAIGSWRTSDGQFPINATGTLPDGRTFSGPEGLETILRNQPEAFAEGLSRKLLTYALGRGLEGYDEAAVTKLVADVKAHDYRFSSVVLNIVKSAPFQMRKGESPPPVTGTNLQVSSSTFAASQGLLH